MVLNEKINQQKLITKIVKLARKEVNADIENRLHTVKKLRKA